MQRISAVFGVGLVLACHSLETTVLAEVPYRIQIVDEQSGRGVPLVELATVNNIRFYTDSLGNAAIDEPGLERLDVFFQIRSHGYEYPADGFGSRGRVLRVEAGESDVVRIRRVNIAERLYRLTGAGIYRDSLMTGQPVPIEAPLLNGQVFGCDSTINVVYCGKLFWFWETPTGRVIRWGTSTRPARHRCCHPMADWTPLSASTSRSLSARTDSPAGWPSFPAKARRGWRV